MNGGRARLGLALRCTLAAASAVALLVTPFPGIAAEDRGDLSALGPVAMWRDRTSVTADGVQAVNYSYADPVDAQPWDAKWISASDLASETVTIRLRRTFDLSVTLPARALADISADRVYRLWVNGVLVSRGPDAPGSDWGTPERWSKHWLYTRLDIAPYLRPGKNVIAAEVFGSDTISSFSLHKTGFAFRLSLNKQGKRVSIDSGTGWKAAACDCYRDGPLADGPLNGRKALLYDARRDAAGWQNVAFDDAAWRPAVPIASRWGRLTVSRIPPRMEAVWPVMGVTGSMTSPSSGAPANRGGEDIVLPGNGSFIVRYDRVLAAYLSVQVQGAPGTIITLLPFEADEKLNARRPVQITLGDKTTNWESPGYDSFSAIRVVVRNASGPVRFHSIRSIFVSQPVNYAGSFDSSDANLNRLWRSIRWLTQICLQDRYLDSPMHQEQLPDPGDYFIEALQNNYAFNEQWVTRQNLRQFGQMLDANGQVVFHTSYSMLWIQMLTDYYQYTGDDRLVRELAPSVNRLMDRLATYKGKDGLLSEAPNYMFMDWGELDGYKIHHPPAMIGMGYLTAFYYQALRSAATISRVAGDSARQQRYGEEAEGVSARFNAELWDPARQLYRDGWPFRNHQAVGKWLPADKSGVATYSPHINYLAVLYGLADKDRGQAIVHKLMENQPSPVQPYFMHFAFGALGKAGLFNRYGWSQMQRWHLNPVTQTFREMWEDGDWSHAWGGTPLTQMSAQILGVTPETPGFATARIAPQIGGLRWAKGDVPTVRGMIHVEWEKTGDRLVLKTTTPKGMTANVVLPIVGADNAGFTLDGVAMKGEAMTVKSGTHVFEGAVGRGLRPPN